jgi:hypothetical protein
VNGIVRAGSVQAPFWSCRLELQQRRRRLQSNGPASLLPTYTPTFTVHRVDGDDGNGWGNGQDTGDAHPFSCKVCILLFSWKFNQSILLMPCHALSHTAVANHLSFFFYGRAIRIMHGYRAWTAQLFAVAFSSFLLIYSVGC